MAKAQRRKAAVPSTADGIHIGISPEGRAAVAQGLHRLLADTWALYLKTHAFHWNVEGPQFASLHLMFEGQYTELWTALDALAERIRALGLPVEAAASQLARRSSVPETVGVPRDLEMVRLLCQGHEAVARTAREVFPEAERAGDEATVDLLTQRLQIHEKTAWMLRSLLR